MSESVGSGLTLSGAIFVVGMTRWLAGDPTGAMTIAAEARQRLDAEASAWVACGLRNLTCLFALGAGDQDTARPAAQEALAIARTVGAPTLLANALSAYSRTVLDENPTEALAAAEESMRLIEAGANDTSYNFVAQTAALVRSARGDYVGAALAIHAGLDHYVRVGRRSLLSSLVAVAALVLAGLRDTSEAAATLCGAVSGPELGRFPTFLPHAAARYEQTLAELEVTLGPDTYARAWQRGESMTYDEIVAYALEQLKRLAETGSEPNR